MLDRYDDKSKYELLAQVLEFLDSCLYTLDDLIEVSDNAEHIKRLVRARNQIHGSYMSIAPIVHQEF